MKRAREAASPGATSRPKSSSRAFRSGWASAFASSAPRRETIASGVPLGTNRPCQALTSTPLMPVSSKLGTSGSAAMRRGASTASALSLPARRWGSAAAVSRMPIGTTPAIRSWVEKAVPR